MPAVADVRTDRTLTDFSVRFTNEEYIADRVFPRQRGPEFTGKDSGKYYEYAKGNLRIETDGPLGERSPASEARHDLVKKDFTLGRYGLKELVLQEEVDNADEVLDPEEDAVEFLTDLLLLARERRAADLLFSTANLTLNTTLSGSSQWHNDASTPLKDLDQGNEAMWRSANGCVMGEQVWNRLRRHPDVLAQFQYTQGGGISSTQFAELIDVDPAKVFIGRARYNTAREGQADAAGYIWGKHCVLLYLADNPGPRAMTATATLQRGGSREVTEWPENDPEATWKKVQDRYVHKIISPDLAYMVQNAVV
jgi:hypothetical protein